MQELSSKRTEFLSFQPPAISEAEIDAVAETLRSGWLTTGPRTAELEARMRDYVEAKHVLAVSSCTVALHLSLVALGVGPGDEVITTSITWPATANVIVHCGATPVFADVRDDTLNIDPAHAAELVTKRTKAILPVDLYGQPADLDELAALGLPLVEDAEHAAESRYRGRKVGSIADLTCFSLYATKNIAAGEGGLISTNRDDLAEALDDLRVMRRGPSARAPRYCRCRSRPLPQTTTSATRLRRCAACTRASPDEPLAARRPDARRLRGRGHVHPLQDRPRQDRAHPRLGERAVGVR